MGIKENYSKKTLAYLFQPSSSTAGSIAPAAARLLSWSFLRAAATQLARCSALSRVPW